MKKLLPMILFAISLSAQAGIFDWIGIVLKPMLFKSSIKQVETALAESNYNRYEKFWFTSPSDSSTESMPDGNIVTIGIYGPSENPWFVLYSINGIVVKFKTLE